MRLNLTQFELKLAFDLVWRIADRLFGCALGQPFGETLNSLKRSAIATHFLCFVESPAKVTLARNQEGARRNQYIGGELIPAGAVAASLRDILELLSSPR